MSIHNLDSELVTTEGLLAPVASTLPADIEGIDAFAAQDNAVDQLQAMFDTHSRFDGVRRVFDSFSRPGVPRNIGRAVVIGAVFGPMAFGINMLVNSGDETPNPKPAVETVTSTTLSEAARTCINQATAEFDLDPDRDVGELIAKAELCRSRDQYSVPGVSGE